MRDSELKSILNDLDKRIRFLENNSLEKQKKESMTQESGITVEKPILKNTPQENYEPSVDETERVAYNKGPKDVSPKDDTIASTARSGDGEPPVDNNIKIQEVKKNVKDRN